MLAQILRAHESKPPCISPPIELFADGAQPCKHREDEVGADEWLVLPDPLRVRLRLDHDGNTDQICEHLCVRACVRMILSTFNKFMAGPYPPLESFGRPIAPLSHRLTPNSRIKGCFSHKFSMSVTCVEPFRTALDLKVETMQGPTARMNPRITKGP